MIASAELENESNCHVCSVIVPAAGLGTRFLPATKTVPKELLPVVDTPGIEICAEEAALLGAKKMIIITAPGKQAILRHFEQFPELEEELQSKGKHQLLQKVRRAGELVEIRSVVQIKPLGLGHAVLQAESALDESENVVAVMLPDDVVMPMGVISEMVKIREQFGGSVLCAIKVDPEEVSNYGIFEIDKKVTAKILKVRGMVEKPAISEAPSLLAATGRYLLDKSIFNALRKIAPGKGGELQLTDAIELLISEGHPVHIVVHEGKRHDLGNPAGYIKACLELGLEHPEYGPSITHFVQEIARRIAAET